MGNVLRQFVWAILPPSGIRIGKRGQTYMDNKVGYEEQRFNETMLLVIIVGKLHTCHSFKNIDHVSWTSNLHSKSYAALQNTKTCL